MLYLKIKDLKFRQNFYKIENNQVIKNFVAKNILSKITFESNISDLHKTKIYLKIFKQKKRRVKNRLVRRCVFTNRGRGVLQEFKTSRLVLRELMGFGIIPGYKKSIW